MAKRFLSRIIVLLLAFAFPSGVLTVRDNTSRAIKGGYDSRIYLSDIENRIRELL